MSDQRAHPDRHRARIAADLHRHRLMDPADAMVNHILDLACEGDVSRARASLREAARRDPAFVDRYERTARVLELLKGAERAPGGDGAARCPDLTARIIDRVEQQRLLMPRQPTLGRNRSAIAGAGLALMAVLGVMQFRTPAIDGANVQIDADDAPLAAQAATLPAGPLHHLLADTAPFAPTSTMPWSLPSHAAAYEGLSRREGLLPLNSPTARRPGERLEAFTLIASWRVAPRVRDELPAGAVGLTEPHEAIEANLRRVLKR